MSVGRHGKRRLAQDKGPGRQGLRLDCGRDEEVWPQRKRRSRLPIWPQVELHAKGQLHRYRLSEPC